MPILETNHLGKVYEGKVPYTALHDIIFHGMGVLLINRDTAAGGVINGGDYI